MTWHPSLLEIANRAENLQMHYKVWHLIIVHFNLFICQWEGNLNLPSLQIIPHANQPKQEVKHSASWALSNQTHPFDICSAGILWGSVSEFQREGSYKNIKQQQKVQTTMRVTLPLGGWEEIKAWPVEQHPAPPWVPDCVCLCVCLCVWFLSCQLSNTQREEGWMMLSKVKGWT